MDRFNSRFYNSDNIDEQIDTISIKEVLNELGIKSSGDNNYNLVLWNDHVNDMLTVTIALYEICKLPESECIRVMLEAHKNGKSIVKSGSFEEMNKLKTGLNDRNLEATVE